MSEKKTPKRPPRPKRPSVLLSRTEAAEVLGKNRRTLEKWAKDGVGPDVILLPSDLPAYHIDDIESFINASRVQKSRSEREADNGGS